MILTPAFVEAAEEPEPPWENPIEHVVFLSGFDPPRWCYLESDLDNLDTGYTGRGNVSNATVDGYICAEEWEFEEEIREDRPGIRFAVGLLGRTDLGASEFTLFATPWVPIHRSRNLAIDLTFPVIWVPGSYRPPWPTPPCPPGVPPPCHFSPPFSEVELDDLEVGPSLVLAPSLDFTFRGPRRFRPSAFFGIGFIHERGGTTAVGDLGEFRVADSTSPILTYGAGLSYSISDKISFRIEARAITTFTDTVSVFTPTGPETSSSVTVFEGGNTTSPLLSFGIETSF